MINTSLVDLLKSLNEEELLLFGDFLNSPFFNKKAAVVKLFDYLKNFHPNFNDVEKLKRENIYRAIYPDKPYSYGVMKNIIYELDLLGEKFLELIGYNENKPEQFKYLLTELTRRNLNKAFKKNFKKAGILLQQQRINDIYFRNKMDIELLKFNFDIKNIGRTEKFFKPDAGKYLISYFMAKFFKINYNNVVNMLNFGSVGHIDFLDEVLGYIRKNPGIDPVIMLYYHNFMLLYKEDEVSYREFKQLVGEQNKNLDRREQFNRYNNLLNFCYGKIISGEPGYYKDLFDIYNEMIVNEIITVTEKDYLDAVHFRLAVETAVKLKRFKWAKQFIDNYSKKLSPNLKQNEINIALANYYLMKKNYDEAQKYLARTHLNTVYDKVYIYILQSMIYYETKQFETLIYEVDAIKHFITNDKILSLENKKSFQKYVKYLNELVKLNTKKQKDDNFSVKQLKERLSSEKGILEKAWLLEKVSENLKSLR